MAGPDKNRDTLISVAVILDGSSPSDLDRIAALGGQSAAVPVKNDNDDGRPILFRPAQELPGPLLHPQQQAG